MKVIPNSVVAFPERYFNNNPMLEKFIVTRLKIRGQATVGVRGQRFKEVCDILKIPQAKVVGKPTIYRGVYFASIERTTRPKASKEDAINTMRQKYIEICSGPKLGKAERLERDIRSREMSINQVQVDLVRRLRALEGRRREHQALFIGPQENPEVKGAEFDKLVAHPDIESVSIYEKTINVFTGPIYITHNNKVRDIGRFKIELSINPTHYLVRMHNLTRKVRGCDHPHVNANGTPCLGNIQECIPNMIADRQFAAAVSVCIQYLKSTNDGGHLSKITDWPLKAEEKRKDGKKVQK